MIEKRCIDCHQPWILGHDCGIRPRRRRPVLYLLTLALLAGLLIDAVIIAALAFGVVR